MTNLEQLSTDVLAHDAEVVKHEYEQVAQEYRILGEQVKILRDKWNNFENEINRRTVTSIDPKNWKHFTPEQWEYVLYTDFIGNKIRYDLAANVSDESGIWFSGYNSNTNQRTIQLVLYRDHPNMVKDAVNNLEIILPHLKPASTEFREGKGDYSEVEAVHLSVLDRDMSEYAVYFALVNIKTGVYYVMQRRYSTTTCNKKFETLEGLVAYLTENHYYQKTMNDWSDGEE